MRLKWLCKRRESSGLVFWHIKSSQVGQKDKQWIVKLAISILAWRLALSIILVFRAFVHQGVSLSLFSSNINSAFIKVFVGTAGIFPPHSSFPWDDVVCICLSFAVTSHLHLMTYHICIKHWMTELKFSHCQWLYKTSNPKPSFTDIDSNRWTRIKIPIAPTIITSWNESPAQIIQLPRRAAADVSSHQSSKFTLSLKTWNHLPILGDVIG